MPYRNKQDNRDHVKRWVSVHKVERRFYFSEYCKRAKIETLSHYGVNGEPRCCWPGCNESDIDVLTLDHIQNDGARDRKAGSHNGIAFYVHLRKREYPEGFQTLCANHQMKKEILRRKQNCGVV